MPNPRVQVIDPSAPQTFRRGTTVVWGSLVGGLIAVVGGLAAAAQHGIAMFAWIAVLLALVVIIAVTMIWPCIVLRPDRATIRNSFVTYEVLYGALEAVDSTRIGVIARTRDGRKIPIAAYTSSSSGKRLQHGKSAGVLVSRLEDRMSAATSQSDVVSTRRLEVVTIAASVVIVVLAVVLTWIAAS